MAYIGGIGAFAGPIIGAIVITFLQIILSDVTSAWQLYFGLMFIGVVMCAPGGIAGWLMLHRQALLQARTRGGSRRPTRRSRRRSLHASSGAIMLIELGNRELALARSEGSAMRLFGFDVDSSASRPGWSRIVLFGGGPFDATASGRGRRNRLGRVNARLRARSRMTAAL